MTQPQTLVWITGATQGIGEQLAKHVPYPNAHVINISRRQHPELETVIADLTDPTSWDVVAEHFRARLSEFRGERAVFIHNANYPGSGFVGEISADEYRKQVLANCAASLVLGDAFVRACDPRFESGLVMISSASARHAMEGMAVYGAAKAGMEQWVRAVRAERKRRNAGPWVVAVRPGFVATDEMLANRDKFAQATEDYPGGAAVAAALDAGTYLRPDESARQIWSLLPPDPNGRNVLFVGEFVEGAGAEATSQQS